MSTGEWDWMDSESKNKLLKNKQQIKSRLKEATLEANDLSVQLVIKNKMVTDLQNQLMKINSEITTKLIKS